MLLTVTALHGRLNSSARQCAGSSSSCAAKPSVQKQPENTLHSRNLDSAVHSNGPDAFKHQTDASHTNTESQLANQPSVSTSHSTCLPQFTHDPHYPYRAVLHSNPGRKIRVNLYKAYRQRQRDRQKLKPLALAQSLRCSSELCNENNIFTMCARARLALPMQKHLILAVRHTERRH